jgi:hypothetical protein
VSIVLEEKNIVYFIYWKIINIEYINTQNMQWNSMNYVWIADLSLVFFWSVPNVFPKTFPIAPHSFKVVAFIVFIFGAMCPKIDIQTKTLFSKINSRRFAVYCKRP